MSNFDRKTYDKSITTQMLRQLNKSHKKKLQKSGKSVKRKKKLKEMICCNQNIFLLSSDTFNRKFAQKILWEKNYELKMHINILKQQNNTIKAKAWNISKENRKMDKQIEVWGLSKIFKEINSKKKPYIDMLTVMKVLEDQDYQIVSMKIQIAKLQNAVQEREGVIDLLQNNQKSIEKYDCHMSYLIAQKRQIICSALYNYKLIDQKYLQKKKSAQEHLITDQQCRKQMLVKNIELKRKKNEFLMIQYENLCREEVQSHSSDNPNLNTDQQIQRLKQETRKIKLEQRDQLKQIKKQVQRTKQNLSHFECSVQEQMSQFIRKKIQLKRKIYKSVQSIRNQFGSKLNSNLLKNFEDILQENSQTIFLGN